MVKAAEKLNRNSLEQLGGQIEHERHKHEKNIFLMLGVLGVLFIFGIAGSSYLLELNLVDAFYFTASTITTVGFGDIVPVTPQAKIFSAIFMVIGVGLGLYLLTQIAGYFLERREEALVKRLAQITTVRKKAHHVGRHILRKAGFKSRDIVDGHKD